MTPSGGTPVPPGAHEPAPESGAGSARPATAEPASYSIEAHQNLLSKALANLAMRDLTLVESLLLLIQRLETREDDPVLLDILYKVDHLGARMRRNCENLLVVAGEPIAPAHDGPVPLYDVVRAAMSEIDHYTRVRIQELPEVHVHDVAADDLSHLLAELMENALANSSDDLDVTVRGRSRADGGLVLEVTDDGIGIPEAKLARINAELREPVVLTDETLRHMGLFVVGLLAHRHGLDVRLQTRPFSGGTSGYVHVPAAMVQPDHRAENRRTSARHASAAPTAPGPAVPSPRSVPAAADGAARAGGPGTLPVRGPARGQAALRAVDRPDVPHRPDPVGRPAVDPPAIVPEAGPAVTAPEDTPVPDTAAELSPLPRRVPAVPPVPAASAPRPEPVPAAGELPPLPQRTPAAPVSARPVENAGSAGNADGRAAASGGGATGGEPDDNGGSGEDDDFVPVRGRPRGGSAPEADARTYAERIRAEFDGYVSGRREYTESAARGADPRGPGPATGADSAPAASADRPGAVPPNGPARLRGLGPNGADAADPAERADSEDEGPAAAGKGEAP